MPEGRRRPPVGPRGHGQIHVAHGPARIGTEAVHGILQGHRARGGLVGGPRDVLDQRQEGGAFLDTLFKAGIEGAQGLLGPLAFLRHVVPLDQEGGGLGEQTDELAGALLRLARAAVIHRERAQHCPSQCPDRERPAGANAVFPHQVQIRCPERILRHVTHNDRLPGIGCHTAGGRLRTNGESIHGLRVALGHARRSAKAELGARRIHEENGRPGAVLCLCRGGACQYVEYRMEWGTADGQFQRLLLASCERLGLALRGDLLTEDDEVQRLPRGVERERHAVLHPDERAVFCGCSVTR